MDLLENERLDYVNDNLSLIQNTEGLTFGTDALLLAGYVDGKFCSACELGGGTGIISMLLLTRGKARKIECVEVQEEYAALIRRNAEYNRLSDSLFSVCADVREYKPDSECELVFTNPPYMKLKSGKTNENEKKTVARHEVFGDISDFLGAASRIVKFGGSFYAVYRPDRLADIVYAMKEARIEPKRMTLVFADTESEASMLLVEGKRGAKSSMRLTRPLFIYKDKSHTEYTDDMNYIMENGSFPRDFCK